MFLKAGSPIDLQMGPTGGIIAAQSYSVELSAPLVNSATQKGSLTKVGDGILTLSGRNTYTGDLFINGGALIVEG